MGRAFVFGDDIDTDVLAPGALMKLAPADLATHCLAAVDPLFARSVRAGDVLVAGRNFGLGSSREQAAVSLKLLGISAVLAQSFARIFYRNAINLGLPAIVLKEAASIRAGDEVAVDLQAGRVDNRTTGTTYAVTPLPPHLMAMIDDGGLIPHLKKRLHPAEPPSYPTENLLTESLKRRLTRKPAVLAAGAYDALSALLIEQAGFEAVYVSGAGIAYTQLGRPDLGLVSFDHLADVVGRMRERVTLPLIVDADTGFGNALNVQRTVRVLERCGANAIQLEDQTFPKRCGHLSNKSLIATADMVGKLRAATDARASAETLIIARTDAIATDGLDAALDRAAAFIDAGADVVFVEAPRSYAEMQRVFKTLGSRVPLLANMVEGGVTPILSCDELSTLGFSLVISPAALIRAQVHLAEDFLRSLKSHGSTQPYADRMLDFSGLNKRIGIEQMSTDGQRYDASFHVAPAMQG